MGKTLPDLLNRQKEILKQINDLLKEEFGVLKECQAFSLPGIDQKKQVLLNELTANDKTIGQLPNRDELKTTYKKAREEIQDLLKECHRQNAVNGKLIVMCMAANRRLGTTLSKIKDRNSMTYDDHGATHSISSSGMDIQC